MPTAITTSKAFQKRVSRRLKAHESAAALQDALIAPGGPPWNGYSPSLANNLTDLSHANVGAFGLISRDGALTLDSGWIRLENAASPSLPLGDDGFGVPAAPASAANAQTIMLLGEVILQHADQLRTAFGLTLDNATSPSGYFWHVSTSGNWTNVPFVSGAGIFGAGSAPTGGRDAVFDWAAYPLGSTAISGNAPGMVVFTNFDDEVYAWDIGAGGIPGKFGSAFSTTLAGAKFHAQSVELYDDRLVFLNTKESSGVTRHPRRFRWTDIGSSPLPTLTGTQSGFIEFDEFLGAGLRALKLGDVCALYFEDGVALARRTFLTSRPFSKEYVSKQRGLLAPQSVVKVTDDAHFGIFTDGWFFFTADGQWREVGITQINQQQSASRWSAEFYRILNVSSRKRITLSFDSVARVVRIAFPRADGPGGGENDTVWVYDLRTDTVWVDEDYEVTAWGQTDRQTSTGQTWASTAPTTWADIIGEWADQAPILNLEQPMHGNTKGMVFGHDASIVTRDGANVAWAYLTHLSDLGDNRKVKIADEVSLEFTTQNTSSNVTVAVANQDGETAGQVIDLQQGMLGRVIRDYVNMRLSGTYLGLRLNGSGPIRIHAIDLKLAVPISSGKRQT